MKFTNSNEMSYIDEKKTMNLTTIDNTDGIGSYG